MKPMEFRVLDADGADASEWTRRIEALPPDQQDLHFLPQYGRIYRSSYGHRPRLAVYGDDRRYVLQPFVVRPLNALPVLASAPDGDEYREIANAYGYGGPAVRAGEGDDVEGMMRGFEAAFVAHGRGAGYASEFTILHPRLRGLERLRGIAGVAPAPLKEVVYVDLAGGAEAIRRNLRKGHRGSLTKARRLGARVARIEPTEAAIEEFRRLYVGTMERRGAEARWYFPERYFRDCFAELGDAGASLFEARVDERLAAGSILLHAFDTAYYHLSGSDPAFLEHGVGTLLVYEMACWAAARGYRWMHLGGGVTASPEDSLLRFKSGFSGVRAGLHGYGRVLDETLYHRLCALKRGHEAATLGREIASDYFPLYRR
jgi:hypothetical protein